MISFALGVLFFVRGGKLCFLMNEIHHFSILVLFILLVSCFLLSFFLTLPFAFMHWGLDGRSRFVIFLYSIIKGNQGLIQDTIPIPPASSADTGISPGPRDRLALRTIHTHRFYFTSFFTT